jgi:hypothetical protein
MLTVALLNTSSLIGARGAALALEGRWETRLEDQGLI